MLAIFLALASVATADESLVPLYLWVAPETQQRFLSMCKEENISISEMLTRWSSARTIAMSEAASPVLENSSVVSAQREQKLAKLAASPGFMLDLRDSDLRLLKKIGKERPVLSTWTTGESKYMNLALNLALSVRRHAPQLERSFLCVALDRPARRLMRKWKFQAVLHAVPREALKDGIWKMRWLMLHTFAVLGISGFVLDSDIVVLQDPFQALRGDADFEVMTDHFWPELHLWQYWTRPEEHINTGCIYVRASVGSQSFLREFLEDHNESAVGGIARHWMDQQVFNKFVEKKIFSSSESLVHGLYEQQVFWNPRALPVVEPLRIRVLDPLVLAHGMNYFWLRVHERSGQEQQPVVAHANGVDGKEYFLRDRGHWYIDDFEKRFEGQRFLTYHHPTGMSLADDFEYLTRAVVAAVALKRRLVLPNTMNCANCPALEAYNAHSVLASGNCTFDYFAWSQSFLGHHGELVAESGLQLDPHFRSIPEETVLQKDVGSLFTGGRQAFEKARRLHLADLEAAYDVALKKGIQPSTVFECRHHDWPVGWMACRDQRFVQFHGAFSRCEPLPEQAGCGYRGITCCDAFWGWGEKLEYFTGKSWDLPCNCGLSACEAVGDTGKNACCAFAGRQARCDRRIQMQSVPEVNTPEDTESLTSTALAELETDSSKFWKTCRLNRQLRASDRSVEELFWKCHRLATRFLLLRQNLVGLGRWCRDAQRLRSMDWPELWPKLADLDMETGELQRKTAWKQKHDREQLRFLQGVQKAQVKNGNFVPALTGEVNLQTAALRAGYLVRDAVLNQTLAEALARWFAEVTVWKSSWTEGVVEASLLDGLSCDALISIASSLKSQLGLAFERMWAMKYDGDVENVEVKVHREEAPDLSAVIWVSEGAKDEGLELSGDVQHFIGRKKNRMVLWGSELEGRFLAKGGADYEARRVDLILSFRKSLGHKLYPGLTLGNLKDDLLS